MVRFQRATTVRMSPLSIGLHCKREFTRKQHILPSFQKTPFLPIPGVLKSKQKVTKVTSHCKISLAYPLLLCISSCAIQNLAYIKRQEWGKLKLFTGFNKNTSELPVSLSSFLNPICSPSFGTVVQSVQEHFRQSKKLVFYERVNRC